MTMKLKQGDVVLVEFVFSEGSGVKRRPALVISGESYHRGRQEAIIAGITSNTGRVLIGDSKLNDWRKAGLRYPSLVAAIVQTVKQKMIPRKLGALSRADLVAVKKNLREAIDL